jgi:hypothetical protein
MINDQEVIYFCFFTFNFLSSVLVLLFYRALNFVIERKIVLMGDDACFRPPIIIKSHACSFQIQS